MAIPGEIQVPPNPPPSLKCLHCAYNCTLTVISNAPPFRWLSSSKQKFLVLPLIIIIVFYIPVALFFWSKLKMLYIIISPLYFVPTWNTWVGKEKSIMLGLGFEPWIPESSVLTSTPQVSLNFLFYYLVNHIDYLNIGYLIYFKL